MVVIIRNLIMTIVLVYLSLLFWYGCSSNTVSVPGDPTFTLSITKPRAIEADSIVITISSNNFHDIKHVESWKSHGDFTFKDLVPGIANIDMFVIKNGFRILDGYATKDLNSGPNGSINITLNNVMIVEKIDNNAENEFKNSQTVISPFWNNLNVVGRSVKMNSTDNKVNINVATAWGENSNGLYLFADVNDLELQSNDNILTTIGEFRSDAFIVYLSNSRSVNDVENDGNLSKIDDFVRIMIEMGNTTPAESKINVTGSGNLSNMNYDGMINAIPNEILSIQLYEIDSGPRRGVELFIPKTHFKCNAENRTALIFKYNNKNSGEVFSESISWKDELSNPFEKIAPWGNLELLGVQ